MYNMPVAVTRKANIYGGGDLNFGRIVPDTAKSLLNNSQLLIRSDGTPQRDYLYIEDAVEGYLTLAENIEKVKGEAFNFSSAQPISVLDLVNKMIMIMGKPITPKILGKAQGEINIQYLANEKARDLLNWKPKHNLEEGLKKTIDWYNKYLTNSSKEFLVNQTIC